MIKQGSNIKQAYEIYSLIGGGYNKRQVHGYAWSKEGKDGATAIAHKHTGCYIGSIHLAMVNGRWHRISVLPTENVRGNPDHAEDSRIADDNLPTRNTPGMFVQTDTRHPVRLGLDIVKSLNMISTMDSPDVRLFTLRTGGPSPLSFRSEDFLNSEALQERVYKWLESEINFRRIHRGLA